MRSNCSAPRFKKRFHITKPYSSSQAQFCNVIMYFKAPEGNIIQNLTLHNIPGPPKAQKYLAKNHIYINTKGQTI